MVLIIVTQNILCREPPSMLLDSLSTMHVADKDIAMVAEVKKEPEVKVEPTAQASVPAPDKKEKSG